MCENVLTLTSPTSYLAKNGIVPFSLFSLCQMLLHLCCIFQHNWSRGEERRLSQIPISQARFMILIKIDYRKFDGWKRLTCENVLTLTSPTSYLVINGIVPFPQFSLLPMLLELCCIIQHNWGRDEEERSSQRSINQARFMILIKIDYWKFDGWKRLTCENVLTLTSPTSYLAKNGIVPLSQFSLFLVFLD